MQHSLEPLRTMRSRLVRAAVDVFRHFKPDSDGRLKELKSQLNHLIAVCNEAHCHEEIELYLRYQSSREGRHIKRELVEAMIDGINTAFRDANHSADSPIKHDAWRLYSVYLAREYTYRAAVLKDLARSSDRNASNDRRPRR